MFLSGACQFVVSLDAKLVKIDTYSPSNMKTCIPQPLILLINSNHLAIIIGMVSLRIPWSACLSLLDDAALLLDIILSNHRICPIHKGECNTEPGGCKPVRLKWEQCVYFKSFLFKIRCSHV